MKAICTGLTLLMTLILFSVAQANPPDESNTGATTHKGSQTTQEQMVTPAPAPTVQSSAIIGRAEADSMSRQSDSLLAQSGMTGISVGSFESTDLIYVLVVVLLVVVIIAVVI